MMNKKNYRKFDDADEFPLLPQNKVEERLLTDEYVPVHVRQNRLYQNTFQDSPKVTYQSNINEMNEPIDLRDVSIVLNDDFYLSKDELEQTTTTTTTKPNSNAFMRVMKKFIQKEECDMCNKKYSNALFGNKSGKKLTLPCCKGHLCCGCKETLDKDANGRGIEILIENRYRSPYDVIKCLECPHCKEIIPQDDEKFEFILEAKNDLIKLFEKMSLMRLALNKGKMDFLLAMLEESKISKEYHFIFMDYLSRHDLELFSLLTDLEKHKFLGLHEEMKLMQNAEPDQLLAFIATHYEDQESWAALMRYISKHDEDLFTLVQALEAHYLEISEN